MNRSNGRIVKVLQREGRALPFPIRGWREQSLESHKQPHQSQKEGSCTWYNVQIQLSFRRDREGSEPKTGRIYVFASPEPLKLDISDNLWSIAGKVCPPHCGLERDKKHSVDISFSKKFLKNDIFHL